MIYVYKSHQHHFYLNTSTVKHRPKIATRNNLYCAVCIIQHYLIFRDAVNSWKPFGIIGCQFCSSSAHCHLNYFIYYSCTALIQQIDAILWVVCPRCVCTVCAELTNKLLRQLYGSILHQQILQFSYRTI